MDILPQLKYNICIRLYTYIYKNADNEVKISVERVAIIGNHMIIYLSYLFSSSFHFTTDYATKVDVRKVKCLIRFFFNQKNNFNYYYNIYIFDQA